MKGKTSCGIFIHNGISVSFKKQTNMEILPCVATRTDLEDVWLSEVSKKRKENVV